MAVPMLATPPLVPVAELTVTVGQPVEAGAVTGAETRAASAASSRLPVAACVAA